MGGEIEKENKKQVDDNKEEKDEDMEGRGRRRREEAGAGAGGKRKFTTNKVIILLIQIKKSAYFKNRESRKNK